MINFKCQHCSEPMEAPDSLAAVPIACPKCQTLTTPVPRFTSTNALETTCQIFAWGLLVVGILWIFGALNSGDPGLISVVLNCLVYGLALLLLTNIHFYVRTRR
jgi:phage FluMu protein Com